MIFSLKYHHQVSRKRPWLTWCCGKVLSQKFKLLLFTRLFTLWETGEIIVYFWGERDLATVQRLKAKLKELGIQYTRIASDPCASFVIAFKNFNQLIGKFFTVGVEDNNYKIRYRIRREFRRSCKFSKKIKNHFKAFDLILFYINNGFI